jgi:hypothetical protein
LGGSRKFEESRKERGMQTIAGRYGTRALAIGVGLAIVVAIAIDDARGG